LRPNIAVLSEEPRGPRWNTGVNVLKTHRGRRERQALGHPCFRRRDHPVTMAMEQARALGPGAMVCGRVVSDQDSNHPAKDA